jgi:hypothetical protein
MGGKTILVALACGRSAIRFLAAGLALALLAYSARRVAWGRARAAHRRRYETLPGRHQRQRRLRQRAGNLPGMPPRGQLTLILRCPV